jgi:hypothetical protein
VADAFADRSCKLIVSPTACTGFGIRSYVRRVHIAWQTFLIKVNTGKQRVWYERRIMLAEIMVCVAGNAHGRVLHEVLASRHALRSGFKLSRGHGP